MGVGSKIQNCIGCLDTAGIFVRYTAVHATPCVDTRPPPLVEQKVTTSIYSQIACRSELNFASFQIDDQNVQMDSVVCGNRTFLPHHVFAWYYCTALSDMEAEAKQLNTH